MKKLLKNRLQALFSLSEEQWNALETGLLERTFPPKTVLIRPGQVADQMYFILSGSVRSYLIRDGNDITDYFFFENSFATDYASYYSQRPAVFYLETMETCTTIQLKREQFLTLSRQYPLFETIGRVMAETAFVEIEERMRLLHHENLETRFRWMMNKFPNVFQRVPQYHIASYLGVKPESLSRIKKTISNQG